MNNIRKLLKRTPHLYRFSHEHHEGLVLANRVKAGVKKSVASSLLASYILSFWKSVLEEHFRLEEDLLLPLMKNNVELCQRFQVEHEEIRRLIALLSEQQREDSLLSSQFAEALHDHIRFEERFMFPKIQADNPETILLRISESLAGMKTACFVFSPKFWE